MLILLGRDDGRIKYSFTFHIFLQKEESKLYEHQTDLKFSILHQTLRLGGWEAGISQKYLINGYWVPGSSLPSIGGGGRGGWTLSSVHSLQVIHTPESPAYYLWEVEGCEGGSRDNTVLLSDHPGPLCEPHYERPASLYVWKWSWWHTAYLT